MEIAEGLRIFEEIALIQMKNIFLPRPHYHDQETGQENERG